MAETSSNGPVPSNHVFIHQISNQEPNTKVRFLGCITHYDHKTGNLTIEHDYPRRNTSLKSFSKAIVDVNLILENTNLDLLQQGSWVNIIGYVRGTAMVGSRRGSTSRRKGFMEIPEVQAVLIWSAGAVKVDKYEKAMEEHLAATDTKR